MAVKPSTRDNGWSEALRRIEKARASGARVLDLGNLQLRTVPDSIAQLTKLKVLKIYGNKLDAIPECVAEPTGIEELFLSYNEIATIPDWLPRLSKLQTLDLGRNKISTNGIISIVGTWTIALFFTGWKHAGENIADVLKQRAGGLPAPIQMCDALSRNTPKGVATLLANCLAHGRRQVVEVVENFPEECRYMLETLGGVYHYDGRAREQKLSPEERLRFHQEHSGPLMNGLHEWMEAQLAEHMTEPNSGLGKATSYLLNHWPKLTLFLRQAGAPLDNNIVDAL